MQDFVFYFSIAAFAAAFFFTAWRALAWLGMFGLKDKDGALSAEIPSQKLHWKEYAAIFASVFGMAAAVYIIGYLATGLIEGKSVTEIRNIGDIFVRWDARHYINIAEHWYLKTGDDQYLIVFFPLYPILIRVCAVVIGNYTTSAFIVSLTALCFAACFFYKLILLDYDREAAGRGLKFMLLYPFAFFLVSAFTESLFIALCVAAVYELRKRRWLAAGIIMACASLTRVQGLLLLAPACIEWYRHMRETAPKGRYMAFRPKGLFIFLAPVGTLIYLWINYSVWGDPFQFLFFQKNHWYQQFGFFASNLKMHAGRIITDPPQSAVSLWIPQVFLFFFSVAMLFVLLKKKVRPSYIVYGLIYLLVSYSPTWLLSGPRYLLSMFPLFIAMALLAERKAWDTVFTVAGAAFSVLYITAFFAWHMVM